MEDALLLLEQSGDLPDHVRLPADHDRLGAAMLVEVDVRHSEDVLVVMVLEVRDAAKMAANWSSALETEDAMTLLHRVVVYGDHMDSIRHLARLMNLTVVEEG